MTDAEAAPDPAPAGRGPTRIELVRRLVRERPTLQPGFDLAWRSVRRAPDRAVEDWSKAVLELLQVNAGPACIEAFWKAGNAAGHERLSLISAGGLEAAAICRHAGARAALACLEALPKALLLTERAGSPGLQTGPAPWWLGLNRLAREAPGLVQGTAGRVETLLAGGGAAFVAFVAAGLKATATDKTRRAAFFSLDDELARSLLRRGGATAGFAECERMLGAYVATLWGERSPHGGSRLRELDAPGAGGIAGAFVARRTVIASDTVLVPAVFAGVPDAQLRPLYRASVAHAQAHLAVGEVRHAIGTLKPLQVALVGLFEDARVEALAIRRFPGLRSAWAAFHVARPAGPSNAASLMARLARALLDPDYTDPDGFVSKGRLLFAEADERREDPASSREIGGLLGNDLGQMRMQFNTRTYVVEPAYRDDNTHLWVLPETQDEPAGLELESARASDIGDSQVDGPSALRARGTRVETGFQELAPLATYPEWDGVAGVERPDWTTLRDAVPVLGNAAAAWAGEAVLQERVARLVRSVVVGPSRRESAREVGEELDLDAAIVAAAAQRCGRTPDSRLYRDRRPRGRDLATLVILDVSQSTAALAAPSCSVLEAERRAVTALALAMEARGDRYALRAFASAGRDDVRLTRLKEFDEPFAAGAAARLASLTPGLSTRLGAALRHAGAEMAAQRSGRKLVLTLTDAEPSDIDVSRPEELVEDARRAVLGLRQRGIDVFGLILDPRDAGSGSAIFGRHNSVPVRQLADLPARLADVYFRLSRR